jgi:hypothetical protein
LLTSITPANFLCIDWQGIGAYLLAHEEALCLLFGVVTRFDNETAMLSDKPADCRDDACPIRAGDGQGVTSGVVHTGVPLRSRHSNRRTMILNKDVDEPKANFVKLIF